MKIESSCEKYCEKRTRSSFTGPRDKMSGISVKRFINKSILKGEIVNKFSER